MPLPTFDSQDAIPEAFRGEYTEREGKWIPKAEGDAAGLRESQRKLLDEKKRLEAEHSKLKGLFGDRKPEEVEEILTKYATAEEERARKAGEFDKLLEKRKKELVDEYEPKVKAGEKAIKDLDDLRFEIAVRELASAAGIPEKNHKAVIRITQGDHLRRVDGKIVVVDSAGDVRSIAPEKFFAEEFKTDYPELYAAAGGSGGGSGGGNGDRQRGGGTGVSLTDPGSFLQNLDKIAKGEVKVTR